MMRRKKSVLTTRGRPGALAVLICLIIMAGPNPTARALITGGEGNMPLADPGWPVGAAAIFNQPSRVAWWEGPPFGGGQWHAECRGNAQGLSGVLADFARLEGKNKGVVLHDGVGYSFWLNPNRDPEKRDAAAIDWSFTVWVLASWERLNQLPADLRSTDPRGAENGPRTQLDVYVGGNVHWPDVTVPDGLQIVDERLEAHGFTPSDGIVLEGTVLGLTTNQPVAARVRLQRVEPQSQGGYQYPTAAETAVDGNGKWLLKTTPPGWYRIVAEADGYAARVIGFAQFDEQPRWASYDCRLVTSAVVSGRVADRADQPLADVSVRLANVTAGDGVRYESPDDYRATTDAEGRFHLENVPVGQATVRLYKAGYFQSGLGPTIQVPVEGVDLTMQESAHVVVTVDFAGMQRPNEYLVHIEPEGGAAVGKWSGSGRIDAENRISFENVPPGRYVLRGSPNPSTAKQQSQPLTIELFGGKSIEITLPAR